MKEKIKDILEYLEVIFFILLVVGMLFWPYATMWILKISDKEIPHWLEVVNGGLTTFYFGIGILIFVALVWSSLLDTRIQRKNDKKEKENEIKDED